MSCLILGALVLTGCSRYASNGENLYLRSHNAERLIVPPPLTAVDMSGFYDLPAQTQTARVRIAPP